MVQRGKNILAAIKDVPTLHRIEEYAIGMGQREKLAVMKDVPTKLLKEECAGVMVLNGYDRGVRTSPPGV